MTTEPYGYGKGSSLPDAGWVIRRGDGTAVIVLPPDLPELVVGAIAAAFQTETEHAATPEPEPGLREHVRKFHPKITLRGQSDAHVARAHGGDHFHFGNTTHHHGPNGGPNARPAGWRTGGGVVLIDREAAMRRRPL